MKTFKSVLEIWDDQGALQLAMPIDHVPFESAVVLDFMPRGEIELRAAYTRPAGCIILKKGWSLKIAATEES